MSIELAYQQLVSSLQTIYENREASTMANWVIEKLTGLNRVDRLINKHQSISNSNKLLLKKMTDELLAYRPIQYVLGEAWFLKQSFFVNESVLIPRPETEELVDWIVTENAQMLGVRILDIGTGSGCIPITLKKQIPASEIVSVDISAEAIAVATKNAIDLGASIRFLTMDFLNENNWNDLPETDIIVSNTSKTEVFPVKSGFNIFYNISAGFRIWKLMPTIGCDINYYINFKGIQITKTNVGLAYLF